MKRALRIGIPITLVLLVFFFALPKIADFSQVWSEVAEMGWGELTKLFLATLGSIGTYWLVMVAGLPGSTFLQTAKVNLASTAVANTLPGGGAFGVGVTYGMYSNYGFSNPEISLQIIVTGIWNNFAKLALPVLALGFLALKGEVKGGLVVAAVVGLLVILAALGLFAAILRSEQQAFAVGTKLQPIVTWLRKATKREAKTSFPQSIVRFRKDSLHLLRKRWLWLTVTTFVSHAALFFVLILALRNVGVGQTEVSWAETLAVFAFVRLISAIPITPGGLGVVELGATAALVAAGGNEAEVVAAVLVYRALTYLLPIPLGIVAYLEWRRGSGARRAQLEADLPD